MKRSVNSQRLVLPAPREAPPVLGPLSLLQAFAFQAPLEGRQVLSRSTHDCRLPGQDFVSSVKNTLFTQASNNSAAMNTDSRKYINYNSLGN
jgi:hypothetical protein